MNALEDLVQAYSKVLGITGSQMREKVGDLRREGLHLVQAIRALG